MNILSRLILGLGLTWAATGLAAAQQPAAPVALSIEAQSMEQALQIFAKQSGLQVIFPTELARDLSAPSVHGSFTPREALKLLLSGAPLSYTFVNDKTVAIRSSQGSAAETLDPSTAGMRVAQAAATPASTPSSPSTSRATNESGQGFIEEIVVTAQKRQERLQDVPISIAVLTGRQLDTVNDRGVSDALNRVPGVSSSPGSQSRFGSASTITVRGVGSGGATASTTAFYLDSVPFGFARFPITPDANVYDMQRLEVLRGPQGTLYGANAMNGVVRVLTQDPNLERFEFKARASTASVDHGGQSYRGDMALNMPIVEGKLAARAVFGYQDESGWIDKVNQKDANDHQVTNARLKINGQPTEQLSLGLSAWLSRADQGAGDYSPVDGLTNASLRDEPTSIDFDAYAFKFGYEFGAVSVSGISSYLDFSNSSRTDYQPVFGLSDTLLTTTFDSKVFSQELLVNSSQQGPWRWSVGGMYRDAEELLFQWRRQYVADSSVTTFSKSFAVFGELTRGFFENRLELTGGLRYFEDKVHDVENSRNAAVVVGGLQNISDKYDHVTPRLVLSWHANPQLTVYSSYSEGFRSGQNQLPAVSSVAPQYPRLDPDKLKNYEVGAKGGLFNGRLNFDTAVYYIDWTDLQQFVSVEVAPTVFLFGLIKSGSASGMGVDFAVTGEAAPGLLLGLNFSWNDLRLDDNVPQAPTTFRKDDRLIASPETTVGASAEYSFPLGVNGYTGRVSASGNYASKIINSKAPNLNYFREPTTMTRLSLGVQSPNGWSASLFADNLNNEKAFVQDSVVASPSAWNTWGRPRTVGAQFEYRY